MVERFGLASAVVGGASLMVSRSSGCDLSLQKVVIEKTPKNLGKAVFGGRHARLTLKDMYQTNSLGQPTVAIIPAWEVSYELSEARESPKKDISSGAREPLSSSPLRGFVCK